MADWGSVPVWVGVAITAAGFVATVYQLRLARQARQNDRERLRREEVERRESMARAVGVKINWGMTDKASGLTTVEVEVVNGGPYLIDGVVLLIQADDPMEMVLGTILAGESYSDTLEIRRTELPFVELTFGAKVLFTDTYGNHWSRTGQTLMSEEQPARIC